MPRYHKRIIPRQGKELRKYIDPFCRSFPVGLLSTYTGTDDFLETDYHY